MTIINFFTGYLQWKAHSDADKLLGDHELTAQNYYFLSLIHLNHTININYGVAVTWQFIGQLLMADRKRQGLSPNRLN